MRANAGPPVLSSPTKLALCALLVHAGLSAQQDRPTFRAGVQSIEVDVRVTDRNGKAVRGLTKNDFTLLDDGVPQMITSATFVDLAVESPVSRLVGRVPDTGIATNRGSGRMWVILLGGVGLRARLVAKQFIEEALGPNDQVAVIPAGGNMSAAQGFTRSRSLLSAAIDRLAASEHALPEFFGDRNGFQVLEDVCNRLGQVAGRRKAVLYFDPPGMFIPEPGNLGAASVFFDQRDALRAATRNNVAIYVVSTEGLPSSIDASTGSVPAGSSSRLVAQAGL